MAPESAFCPQTAKQHVPARLTGTQSREPRTSGAPLGRGGLLRQNLPEKLSSSLSLWGPTALCDTRGGSRETSDLQSDWLTENSVKSN